MGVLSTTFSNDLINLIFKGVSITGLGDSNGLKQATPNGSGFQLGLFAQDGSEVNYAGYSRQFLGFSQFDTSTDKYVKNLSDITFLENNSTDVTISSYKVFYGRSTSDGGSSNTYTNVVWFANFDSNQLVSNGEAPKILAGEIKLTIY